MSEIIGNRYKLIKLLGGGGMANVYLAYDTILNREVAIKILKSELANDSLALERFAREAKASARLTHSNIVETYDVGDYGDKHYIVMEYIKGYTLKKLIEIRGALPYKESVWLIKQLSFALLEAHTNGILHRDIKSQNVLIKDDGTIKMADFGIAQAMNDVQLTNHDTIVGSVHYLAPELTKGKSATMQSDIYSLGIVFYELLTGDVPFKGESPVSVAIQHVNKDIPSVRRKNPSIPQSVENIVIKATAKNPKDRYSNCAELINDLNKCLLDSHKNDQPLVLNNNYNLKTNPTNPFIDVEKPSKKESKKHSNLGISFVIIILIIVMGFVGLTYLTIQFINGNLLPTDNTVKMVTIPDISGLSVVEASDVLENRGLTLDLSNIQRVITDDVEEGKIISFEPEAGTSVSKGTKVHVVVSKGVYSVLDNYVGKYIYDVKELLSSTNIKATFVKDENSSAEPGKILTQSLEPGYKYDPTITQEITFTYSKVTTIELTIGSYIGQPIYTITELLADLGIKYRLIEKDISYFTEDEQNKYGEFIVIRMNPNEGTWYTQEGNSQIELYYYVGMNKGDN